MPAGVLRPYKVSAAYRAQLALGARWVEEDGWRLPDSFTAPESEARKAGQDVAILDESHRGKIEVAGRGAAELLGRFGPIADGVGSSRLALAVVAEPLLSLRLAVERFLILTPSAARDTVHRTFEGHADLSTCVHCTDLTSGLAAFLLLGPRARDVLARVTALDLRERSLPDGACAQCPMAKIHAIIARSDWGSLTAYRLLVARDVGEYAWDVLWEAGHDLGLAPIGRAAERILRAGVAQCISS